MRRPGQSGFSVSGSRSARTVQASSPRAPRAPAKPTIGTRNPKTPTGFTLLEVILAVVLTIALCGAVYSFYHLVLGTGDDVRQQGQKSFAQRRVLELMAEEMTSAIVYPFLQFGMNGDGETVTFMRTTLPSRAVFWKDELVNAPPPAGWDEQDGQWGWEPEHDIQRVEYRLKYYEDEDGVEQVAGLERTSMRTIAAKVAEEREEEAGQEEPTAQRTGSSSGEGTGNIRVVFLTEHVKFLRFQYWDGSGWQETWQGSGLPLAVWIELGSEPLPEDMAPDEYPYETVYRIVAIPAGYKPAEGTVAGVGRMGSPQRRGGRQR